MEDNKIIDSVFSSAGSLAHRAFHHKEDDFVTLIVNKKLFQFEATALKRERNSASMDRDWIETNNDGNNKA